MIKSNTNRGYKLNYLTKIWEIVNGEILTTLDFFTGGDNKFYNLFKSIFNQFMEKNMNQNKLLKKLSFLLVVLALACSFTFAQNTIYVDVTNGSDTYTGVNATNSPAGTGPKATIAGGLGVLEDGGTLVIKAGTYNGVDNAGGDVDLNTGTYSALKTGFTIELQPLNLNTIVQINSADFIVNIFDATVAGNVNIVSTGSAKLQLANSQAITLTKGNLNIDAATSFVMGAAGTINFVDTNALTGAAPTAGATSLSLSYTGSGTFTAGPEAAYADYNAGTITVANTSGLITFPNAITEVAGITLSGAASATFNSAVTLGAFDITNSSTGTLTFKSTVGLASLNATGAHTDIGQILNSGAGTIIVEGVTTWSNADLSAARDFDTANFSAILNNGGGTVTLGDVVLSPDTEAGGASANIRTVDFSNVTAAGTITFGTVTATGTTTQTVLNVYSSIAGGTVNIGGGSIHGLLTNVASANTNVTGATTVSGVLTNAGTLTLNGNLTLDGDADINHLTNNGTTAGSAKLIVAAPTTRTHDFNGGGFANLEVNSVGNVDFITAAFTATNLELTAGTVGLDIAGTIANLTVSGATANIATAIVQTVTNYTQSGGSFTLDAGSTTTLDIKGDFNRTAGTFADGGAGNTLVSFTGSGAQSINGGPLFQVENLTFNNAAGTLTVGNSIRADGNVILSTATNVDFNTTNLILNGGTNGITNNGTYTATGGGGIVLGGVTQVVGGAAGNGYSMQGTGTYSYVTVDVGDVTNAAIVPTVASTAQAAGVLTVTMSADITSLLANGDRVVISGHANADGTYVIYDVGVGVNTNFKIVSAAATSAVAGGAVATYNTAKVTTTVTGVKWNGVLTLKTGALTVATSGVDFAPSGTAASIVRYPQTAPGLFAMSGATFNAANVSYDLTYTGTLTADQAVGQEILATPANVKTWTIETTDTGGPWKNTLPATGLTFGGTLIVQKGAELNLLTGGVANITLNGTGKDHVVAGKITLADAGTDFIVFSGTGTLTGSADKDDPALLEETQISSTDLTITNINSFAATLETTAAAVVKLGMGADAADNDITGAATFAGNVTLTSDIDAIGGVTVAANATLAFGENDLTVKGGNFAGATTSTYTAGTGALVMHTPAVTGTASTLNLNSVSIPNLTVAWPFNMANPGTVGTAAVVNAYSTTGTAITADAGADGNVNTVFTTNNHGLATGDWIYVTKNTGSVTSGYYQVTYVDANNFKFPFGYVDGDDTETWSVVPAIHSNTNDLTIPNSYTTNSKYSFDGTGALVLTGTTVTASLDNEISNVTVNSSGTATFASSSETVDRVFTITGVLTQTKGVLAIGEQDLSLTGTTGDAFTRGTEAGDFSAGTGQLIFAGTADQDFNPGTGLVVPNLTINNTGTEVETNDDKTFTVSKVLDLVDGNLQTTNAGTDKDGLLIVAADATIKRDAAKSSLINTPTFGTTVDLYYQTAGGTTGKEVPATASVLQTVEFAVATILDGDMNVNKLAKLTGGALTPAASKELNLVAKTTELQMNGGTIARKPVATNHYVLRYTSNYAGGAVADEFISASIDSLIVEGTVDLAANSTVNNLELNTTGSLDINTFSLTVTGNIDYTKGSVIATGATTNALILGGSALQTLNIPSTGWTLPNNVNLTLNNAYGFKLTGGDLTMGTGIVDFTSGVLNTDANKLVLNQTATSQGFTRANVDTNVSHVMGNVAHSIHAGAGNPSNANPNGRFEFPVGSATQYRPYIITFTSTYPAINPTTVVVSHEDSRPTGTKGFGVGDLENIGNYPDQHWKVNATPSSFTSTQLFDVEIRGTNLGYPYDDDNDLRIIRRQDGSAEGNSWFLQGDNDKYVDNYHVTTDTDTSVIVRATASTGGITTDGTLFTIGMPTQAPVFTSPAGSEFSVYEDSTLTIQFTADPNSIGATVTYSLVEAPDFAAINATTGLVTLTPAAGDYKSSPYTLKVKALSSENLETVKEVKINVVHIFSAPVFTARINNGEARFDNEFTFTYKATDADEQEMKFYLTSVTGDTTSADTLAKLDTTGVFTWTPAKADSGKMVYLHVKVADANDTTMITDTLTVTGNRAPVITKGIDMDTLDVNQVYTTTFEATDADGDALTWTLLNDTKGATLSEDGSFTWDPSEAGVGTYLIKVKVMDTEGAYATANYEVRIEGVVGINRINDVPEEYYIGQNYPNPFNPTTKVKFGLKTDSEVKVVVYNILGQVVDVLADETMSAGTYILNFDASHLPSGIYIYRIKAVATDGTDEFITSRKSVLVK